MKQVIPVSLLVWCLGLPSVGVTGIIDDLANATILEEFLFDDVAGTRIDQAANNVATHPFDIDADTADVVTNGLGQLNASLKANADFGTNYVDNDTLTDMSGRIFGVMEMTWNFESTLDVSENEELRISLIQFDPRSTFVVAEFEIQREDDDTLTMLGNAVGMGSTDLGPVVLNGGSLAQADTFIAVVDVDMNLDQYFIHFSADGGLNFTTLGAGLLDPMRNTVDSLRLTLNNDLSDDNVLIDRIYLARLDPSATSVPAAGPITLLLLGMAMLGRTRRRKTQD